MVILLFLNTCFLFTAKQYYDNSSTFNFANLVEVLTTTTSKNNNNYNNWSFLLLFYILNRYKITISWQILHSYKQAQQTWNWLLKYKIKIIINRKYTNEITSI